MKEILVGEYRNEVLENEHFGHICVVSDRGNIEYAIGDAEHITFLRSSAKPIQCLPGLMEGIDEQFQFTGSETAIMAGSHLGEDFHIEAIQSMMRKVGVSEEKLVCGHSYPGQEAAKISVIQQHQNKQRMFHNCSGKHLGMLAYCKGMGLSIDHYDDPEHPIHKSILDILSLLSECPRQNIKSGVDGCGLPVYALPLRSIAEAYRKMACPHHISNSRLREAVIKITRYMNEHPKMIGGTDFICSLLLEDPNIVAKGGAEGVYCLGLKKEGLGIALKVMSGSQQVWGTIIAAILRQIGYDNQETIKRLSKAYPDEVMNSNGKTVGLKKALFLLNRDGMGVRA